MIYPNEQIKYIGEPIPNLQTGTYGVCKGVWDNSDVLAEFNGRLFVVDSADVEVG